MRAEPRPTYPSVLLLGRPASVGQCVGFLHEKPGTDPGVNALVEVTGVPGDVAFGITLPDEEPAGSRARSRTALAGRTPDDDDVPRQLVQVDRPGDGLCGAVEGTDRGRYEFVSLELDTSGYSAQGVPHRADIVNLIARNQDAGGPCAGALDGDVVVADRDPVHRRDIRLHVHAFGAGARGHQHVAFDDDVFAAAEDAAADVDTLPGRGDAEVPGQECLADRTGARAEVDHRWRPGAFVDQQVLGDAEGLASSRQVQQARRGPIRGRHEHDVVLYRQLGDVRAEDLTAEHDVVGEGHSAGRIGAADTGKGHGRGAGLVHDDVGFNNDVGRRTGTRGFKIHTLIGTRDGGLDIAVAYPHKLSRALEAHTGALVLDEAAFLHPDLANLLTRATEQTQTVAGALEHPHPVHGDLCGALGDVNAVHLLAGIAQREVGAVHGQLPEREVAATKGPDHVGIGARRHGLVGHEANDSRAGPRTPERKVPQVAQPDRGPLRTHGEVIDPRPEADLR